MKKRRLRKEIIIGIAVVSVLLIAGGIFLLFASGNKETAEEDEIKEQLEQTDKDYDKEAGVIDTEVYDGTVLIEVKADKDYLDDTLFLGDSNTARFSIYANKDGEAFADEAHSVGVVGMGVGAISTLKCMEFQGIGSVTMPKAVEIIHPKRVIITMGTNNLSGTSTDATNFIKSYREGIKAVHDAYPYADIIINAIPPVAKSRDYPNVSMTQIDAYNKAIVEMCEEEGYKFLNSSEVLKDETTGFAKEGYMASDGLHLSQKGIQALFDYVTSHALITEDKRPKPLAAVPKVIGVPHGLISDNPLATSGSNKNVPVEFYCTAGGHLEGPASQSVPKGSGTAVVRAVADEGYTFVGWTSNLGEAFYEPSIAYTVPDYADANGVILTATFVSNATPEPEPEETPVPEQTEDPTQQETETPPPVVTYTVQFLDCAGNQLYSNVVEAGASITLPENLNGISWDTDSSAWANVQGNLQVHQTGCEVPDPPTPDPSTQEGCEAIGWTWDETGCHEPVTPSGEDDGGGGEITE